jgi:hypothetical protein
MLVKLGGGARSSQRPLTSPQYVVAALALLVVALLGVHVVGGAAAVTARGQRDPQPVGISGSRHDQPASEPTGCTLTVRGAGSLTLSNDLAMTLTDIAGSDQNHAAPMAHTVAAIAAAWPAQATRAADIALSLTGYVPGALACTAELAPAGLEGMQPDGLTLRANAMWEAIKSVFGPLPAGGFAPGGVHTGHIPGSAHYEGRAIDFLYRPITAKSTRHGWVLAQWLEAHGSTLQIAHVIFDAQIWTPGTWANRGWRPYVDPAGPTADPTLEHLDHVHVDVVRGM